MYASKTALAATLLGSIAAVNAAKAADLEPTAKYQYEAPALLWQGLYAGIHVGGLIDGEANFDFQPGTSVSPDTNGVDLEGLLAGAHLGYNAQFGSVVIGIEGDAAFGKTDDPTECPFVGGLGGGSALCETSINALYSVRGRLGVTLKENLLFYGTGGFAIADVEHTADFGGQGLQDASNVDGFTYGGGMEYMHRSGVTIGIEMLHYDFNSENFNLIDTFGNTIPTDIDMDTTIIKGRVGFHFN